MDNLRYTNIDNFLSYCYTTGLQTSFKLDKNQTAFSGKCAFADASIANLTFNMNTQEIKIAFLTLAKKYNRDWISYFSELSPRLAEGLLPGEYRDLKLHIQTERTGLPTLFASFFMNAEPLNVQRSFFCVDKILTNLARILPVIDIITDGEYVTFPAAKQRNIVNFSNVKESLRLINQAHTYTSEGKYSEAIATAARAIQLTPSNAYAYNNRGYAQAMLLRGYSKEAAADYQKAIILYPQQKTFYFNAGDIELCAGHYEEAKKFFEQALTIDSNYDDAKQMLEITKQRMQQ